MPFKIKMFFFVALCPLVMSVNLDSAATPQFKGDCTISIKVTNIRNTKGTMQIQIYTNNTDYKNEEPFKSFRFSKKTVKDKTMKINVKGLTPGTYGVALLDDENSNKEMDYGLLLPIEGFGFSDYYHTGWSRPTFYDFDFKISTSKSVVMKVRYL